MTGLSQRQRVLRALYRAGTEGITAADFAAPNVIDGDKPIMRLAARIEELREDGYPIHGAGRRGTLKVYALDSELAADPGESAAPVPVDPDPPLSQGSTGAIPLFEPTFDELCPPRPRSPYDLDDAA